MTVIDTHTDGGPGIGLVAMIEVVALMIGDILQCYSERSISILARFREVCSQRKGDPKSLYRPGSSTTVLLFQENRIDFAVICCVICIVKMSGAESPKALVDRWWRQT